MNTVYHLFKTNPYNRYTSRSIAQITGFTKKKEFYFTKKR